MHALECEQANLVHSAFYTNACDYHRSHVLISYSPRIFSAIVRKTVDTEIRIEFLSPQVSAGNHFGIKS